MPPSPRGAGRAARLPVGARTSPGWHGSRGRPPPPGRPLPFRRPGQGDRRHAAPRHRPGLRPAGHLARPEPRRRHRPRRCRRLPRHRPAAHRRRPAHGHRRPRGHRLRRHVHARLPAGSTGTAVLAAPRIVGWRCATGDGAERPARTYHGLVAAPLDGSATTLTCTFHPPGLRLGSAIGGLALLATTALAVLAAARRRRTPAPVGPADGRPTPRARDRRSLTVSGRTAPC